MQIVEFYCIYPSPLATRLLTLVFLFDGDQCVVRSASIGPSNLVSRMPMVARIWAFESGPINLCRRLLLP